MIWTNFNKKVSKIVTAPFTWLIKEEPKCEYQLQEFILKITNATYIFTSLKINSDKKLVKMIMDAATLTGFCCWNATEMVKEKDPSNNLMNYAKFTAVIILKQYLKDQKFFTTC